MLKKLSLALGALTCLVTLAASLPACAAPTATNNQPPGEGLEISPPVIEINADPGQTVVAKVLLRNVTASPLAVKTTADDFTATGENGDPKLLLNETEATRYSLKFWVPPIARIILAGQQSQTITVPILIPPNAEPGGHYGVIRFTAAPPSIDQTGVALSASIGALVLLKVSGPITDKLNLIEFYVTHNGHRTSFFESGPIGLVERIQNDGTVHEKPTGSLSVTGWFGQKVASMTVNDPARNVLPGSIRRFDQTLAKKWLFGHYTAKLNLTYASQQPLVGVVTFWVIPYKQVIVGLLALIIIILLFRTGIRRYNRMIIERARQRK